MISCKNQPGSDNDQIIKNKEKVIIKQDAPGQVQADNEYMDRGKKIYDRVCLVCHQSDGSGVPMMYPPVIESEYISGNTDSLIVLILEGMSGPVLIKGEEYNSIMPPMKDVLDDREVADLINYLRNSFGNSGERVSPGQVAEMRE
ncbi:MAG: cytochrome c [Bacteroidales bacterium]|nr:cytochrome c [Bacteroidales bacterium]